jgi:hypothetical protein
VPQKYQEDPSLGEWVRNQRTCFKNGKMDQGRKRMLDEIGFDFAPGQGFRNAKPNPVETKIAKTTEVDVLRRVKPTALGLG